MATLLESINAATSPTTAPTTAPTTSPTPVKLTSGKPAAKPAAKPTTVKNVSAADAEIARLNAIIASMAKRESGNKVTGLESIRDAVPGWSSVDGANKLSSYASIISAVEAMIVSTGGKNTAVNNGALAVLKVAHNHRVGNHFGNQKPAMQALEDAAARSVLITLRKYGILKAGK